MSEENLELIRRAGALFNEGSVDIDAGLAELYHPDVETRDLQPPPDVPAIVRGRAEVAAGLKRWMELFDDWSIEVHEYVDVDPWVVCDLSWRATGRGSEVAVDWRVADAYEVRDGMIVRAIHNFPDVAAALEAVRAEGATI
jgi:ketosteroid isomerase-like protein